MITPILLQMITFSLNSSTCSVFFWNINYELIPCFIPYNTSHLLSNSNKFKISKSEIFFWYMAVYQKVNKIKSRKLLWLNNDTMNLYESKTLSQNVKYFCISVKKIRGKKEIISVDTHRHIYFTILVGKLISHFVVSSIFIECFILVALCQINPNLGKTFFFFFFF